MLSVLPVLPATFMSVTVEEQKSQRAMDNQSWVNDDLKVKEDLFREAQIDLKVYGLCCKPSSFALLGVPGLQVH